MFRLIRLAILLMAAFITGMAYERGQGRERCEASGGTVTSAGICAKTGG